MKRVLSTLVFACLLLSTQTATAQLSVGFIGIFNLPNLTIEAEGFGKTSGITSFGGGIHAEYMLGPDFSVVVQPTYLANKGTELNSLSGEFDELLEGLENVEFSSDIKISTIEVPLMIKYYFSDYSARPYITAGPSFGFISTAELALNLKGTIPAFEGEPAENFDITETEDIKEELSSMDMSFLLGLGVDVPMGSANYFMDARYAFGMTNLVSDGDGSIKSKGLQISAGARFPIGGN
jgi:hypothetical protein